jgi:Family of unknown function (DUF5324)
VRRPSLHSHRSAPALEGAGLSNLRGRAQVAAQEAVETLGPRIDGAREALTPRIDAAKEAFAPRIEVAGERLVQAADRAGEWAAPRLESAREQTMSTVREQVAPRVAKALASAVSTTAPARDEAKQRGEAALAALRGELPARNRRWPRALLLLTTGAAAGAVAGLFARRREPAYPSFEAYPPVSSAPDPYAQPGSAEPAAPVVTPAPTGPGDATIDVTDPVGAQADGAGEPATPPRRRRRTTTDDPTGTG